MGFLRDVLYALRTFRQSPGFTAVVVLSISLGIAATTTVFSIVNGLFFGSLPVEQPGRLVTFSAGRSDFSYPDYLDYREQTQPVFEGVSAHFPLAPASVGGSGEPERIWGQLVSGNYFRVIGIRPSLGRGILPEEDRVPGRDAVIVLSHPLWKRRFRSDPAAIGQRVMVNGRPFTIVGIAPAGFEGTDRGIVPEFWAPLAMYEQLVPDLAKMRVAQMRNGSWLVLHGRLKPGVARAQALAAVIVAKKRIDDTYFPGDEHRRRRAVTLDKPGGLLDGSGRQAVGLMTVLMVVVALVLLIACANVTNLLLARATTRHKEIAIRLAIGAGRARLLRQLLTESVLLGLMGAAAGFTLAYAAASALSGFHLPLPIPMVFNFRPDWRVLAFTAGLSLFTGILFGLAPAVRATRPDLVPALKNEAVMLGRVRRFGMRGALVVLQVAVSLVLVIGTGLFLRSLGNASSADIGIRPDNVLLMAVDPKLQGYSRERTRQFLSQVRERVSALPGVRSLTFLDSVPLSVGGSSFDFRSEDGGSGAKETNADIYRVGSGFFETTGLPLRRGRDFDGRRDDKRVAIINETMARRLFGDREAVGRQITANHAGTTYTVIGLAGSMKSRTLGEPPAACAFLFLEPEPDEVMSFFGLSIAVRTAGNPRAQLRAVREQIAAFDPNLATFNTETLEEHVSKALLVPRVCAALLTIFGAVGLVLAAVGLYGLMSYSVRGRTREFGIRMALGARPQAVLATVARQGLALAAVGLAIGLGIALALSRFASALLYGVAAIDAVTFTAVPAVLLAVALVAVLLPARRAARVQPVRALRYE